MTSSADWDEIKRLAADFQKAQLSSTVQRLSERNCIEIVTKLIELKLINVIFTNDGKEYLTSQQLVREIKDELFIHGGRINVVDLAKELNVDLNQINTHIPEIIKGKEVQLVSGYLISQYYLEKVASEINEKLQLQGQLSINELTLQYDLPAELLQHSILENYLGKLVFGKQDASDPRTFYTDEYIAITKAKIRGALMGLLKPTPASVIINNCNLSDKLFMSLFDQVNAPGVLTGRQAGSLYVPSCHTKSQNEWVLSFFKQNNYLEYDALSRLGIADPKNFIKRILPKEDLVFLSSCAIGAQIKQHLETALEECIASKSYLDVVSQLPSIFSDMDIEKVLDDLLKKNAKSTILFENTVFSNSFIEQLKQACLPTAQKKAEGFVKSGKYQQHYMEQQLNRAEDNAPTAHLDHKAERREERRRKAGSGKGGGGTQGRETKTKAVKKHNRSKQAANDSDSDTGPVTKKTQVKLEILTVEDIESIIKPTLESENLDDLVTQIAEYLHGSLNQTAIAIAKDLAEKQLQDASQSRKQTHSSAQDKINILVNDIKLYEKGLKAFPFDQQPQFIKYLLKSFGADVLTEFCKYGAAQTNLPFSDEPTVEQRNKLISDLPDEFKKPFKALNSSLSDNMDAFYQAVDECLLSCEMILKKADKKKDKLLIQNHRERLISELESCSEPALALHLVALAAWASAGGMLHAPGRLVPIVLAQLKAHLSDEHYRTLQDYHELVAKYLTAAEDDEKAKIEESLVAEMPNIKSLIQDIKKYK